MKIVVLGSTGMLGNAVGKYMIEKYGEDNVFLSYRNKDVAYGKNTFYFDALDLEDIPQCDYLINCIGIIKPFMKNNIRSSIYLNSVFPYALSEFCNNMKYKMIHITTDCVFSGKKGNYTEKDIHDAEDEYGKSKSLGEGCSNDCMVIRTSIIGEEIHKNASLIEWVKSQKGKTVNGYTNHFWNGVTTKQYAKVCSQIIDNNLYEKDLFHVFSNIINKYELVSIINERFSLDLTINKFEPEQKCDRTLSTIKSLNEKLDIPSIRDQILNL